ncbi:AlkA N-terminal domain-containing protein [Kineosporia mesophila]|uniref:DNA-3-methyladenine glycosylase II n=1 Tax=Kineosporia mesophila TaxID=566012 RepID=A0ABP6ZNF3_9ACTN
MTALHEDPERCVRIVQSHDERFDGFFFTAVLTTRIYCRPSCPAVPPKPKNMRFYPSAAAAAGAGFRACKRCRPQAAPGSPDWNVRADLVARAMRLITDGVIDRDGVPGLASRLGYSVRQVERHLMAEVGAGPLALARMQRAQSARLLIESTPMPFTEIALAAGFSSVRSFNETVREVFALTPGELRAKAGSRVPTQPGAISLKLPFRRPFCPDNLFGHLAATAVPGVEEWRDGAYRCAFRLPNGHAIAALRPLPDHIACQLRLTDPRDLTAAISRCRWLLDLDADPVAIDDQLARDEVLAPLVEKTPGRRVPRIIDPEQFAVRAVLGQQVSTAAARTHAARLVQAHGEPIDDPAGGLTHLFPTSQALAELDPESLALPRARRVTLMRLVEALNSGEVVLDIGGDWNTAREQLSALPGFGPWTVESIAMRALGDPDAFIPGDLGVRQAAQRLGLPDKPGPLVKRAEIWRPWRAYAVQHLWGTSGHPVNQMPPSDPDIP